MPIRARKFATYRVRKGWSEIEVTYKMREPAAIKAIPAKAPIIP